MVIIQLIRIFRRIRATKTLGLVAIALLLLIAIAGNAACYLHFDGADNPDITVSDAIWYSVISVTTIGYGDYSAVSTGARIGTFFFIVMVGLTAFSLFFGLLIDWFTDMALKGARGMARIYASNHTIIVHCPSEARVRQLVEELQCESETSQEVVIVADNIETLPFQAPNCFFVRGSSLSEESYRQAGVEKAAKVIVLATAYDDPNSDAVVASACSVIDSIRPEAHIVAECLNEKHRKLFDSVNADAVVFGLRMTGNLLVQESQDRGISQVFDIIMSNLKGDTLYSTPVAQPLPQNYGDLAKGLLDANVNLLSVVRGKETFTTFSSVPPQEGDCVIYLADRRRKWDQLAREGGVG